MNNEIFIDVLQDVKRDVDFSSIKLTMQEKEFFMQLYKAYPEPVPDHQNILNLFLRDIVIDQNYITIIPVIQPGGIKIIIDKLLPALYFNGVKRNVFNEEIVVGALLINTNERAYKTSLLSPLEALTRQVKPINKPEQKIILDGNNTEKLINLRALNYEYQEFYKSTFLIAPILFKEAKARYINKTIRIKPPVSFFKFDKTLYDFAINEIYEYDKFNLTNYPYWIAINDPRAKNLMRTFKNSRNEQQILLREASNYYIEQNKLLSILEYARPYIPENAKFTSYDDLKRALKPNEFAKVTDLYEKELLQRNNKCAHIKLLRTLLSARSDNKCKRAFSYLKSFTNLDICSKCNFPVLCPHEIEQYNIKMSDIPISHLDEKKRMLPFIKFSGSNLFCKLCNKILNSHMLYDARDIEIDDELKTLIKTEAYFILTRYIVKPSTLDVRHLVDALIKDIYIKIFDIDKQILKVKTNSLEDSRNKKRLNIIIYIWGWLIVAMQNNAEITLRGVVNKIAKTSDLIRAVLTAASSNIAYVFGDSLTVSLDWVKIQLVTVYKELQHNKYSSRSLFKETKESVIQLDMCFYALQFYYAAGNAKRALQIRQDPYQALDSAHNIKNLPELDIKSPLILGEYNALRIALNSETSIYDAFEGLHELDQETRDQRILNNVQPRAQSYVKKWKPISPFKAGRIWDAQGIMHKWSAGVCKICSQTYKQAISAPHDQIWQTVIWTERAPKFFDYTKLICPVKTTHTKNCSCGWNTEWSRYIKGPLSEDQLIYIKKYYNKYKKSNSRPLILEERDPYIKPARIQWTHNYDTILKLASTIKVNPKVLSALGAMEKQIFTKVASGEFIPQEAKTRDDLRIHILNSYVQNLIIEYNRMRFYYKLIKPSLDLVKVIETHMQKSNTQILQKLPTYDKLYLDYFAQFKSVHANYKAQEIVLFCLQSLCELALEIYNYNDEPTKKIRQDFISYYINRIMHQEELTTKDTHFNQNFLTTSTKNEEIDLNLIEGKYIDRNEDDNPFTENIDIENASDEDNEDNDINTDD